MHTLILWNCRSKEEAQRTILKLLEERLIACANILPGISSYFIWKGELEQADEVTVMIKSKRELFSQIQEFIKANSSYEVPEILEIGIERGYPPYLEWVDQTLKGSDL